MSWSEYARKNRHRSPHALLLRTLESIAAEKHFRGDRAIELGCGVGIETNHLARLGWKVLALDIERKALESTRDLCGARFQANVRLQQTAFESVASFPPSDLIFSYHGIPFCPEAKLPTLLQNLARSLVGGGYLALAYFGEDDPWVRSGLVSALPTSLLRQNLPELEVISETETRPTFKEGLDPAVSLHFRETILRLAPPT